MQNQRTAKIQDQWRRAHADCDRHERPHGSEVAAVQKFDKTIVKAVKALGGRGGTATSAFVAHSPRILHSALPNRQKNSTVNDSDYQRG